MCLFILDSLHRTVSAQKEVKDAGSCLLTRVPREYSIWLVATGSSQQWDLTAVAIAEVYNTEYVFLNEQNRAVKWMWISTPDPLALSGQSGRCSWHFTYQALGCPAEDLPLLSRHWCKAHTDAQDAEDAQLVKTAIGDNTYTGPHTGPVHRLADYSRPARKSGAVVLWTSAVTVSPQNALSTGKGTIQ